MPARISKKAFAEPSENSPIPPGDQPSFHSGSASQPENNRPLAGIERTSSPSGNIFVSDPLQDLFGPDSRTKYLGEAQDSVPDEIMVVLEENGLGEKAFQCILKEIPQDSSGKEPGDYKNCSSYIKGFNSIVPSTEWIARNYGPGSYLLSFKWQNRDEGKRSTEGANVIITISDKYTDEYKQYKLERKIKLNKEASEKIQEALLDKRLEHDLNGGSLTPAVDPKAAAKEYVSEALETARLLGLGPQRGIEWDKILPIAVPAIIGFLQAQQNASREMLQMMLAVSGQNNNQLLELAKINNGQGQGAQMFKEMKDMLMGAVDLKSALMPEKETVADKIFKVVEGVLPQVLQIAAMSAEQRNKDFRVKMAQQFINQDPDFQQMIKNPVIQVESIEKLDEHFGWEQTDAVLSVAGIARPGNCPRDPAKQYAIDDPRRPSTGPGTYPSTGSGAAYNSNEGESDDTGIDPTAEESGT